jgi:cytosine/adenosine deaminase-related metal-dependent hydrolase
MPDTWAFTARWIIPVDSPPLEGGVVVVAGEIILDVVPRGKVRADVDLGNSAVLPGLVNAHTHLDLSGVSAPIPFTGNFSDWLRGVIAFRRARSPCNIEADIRKGLGESLARGVTLLGDVSATGESWNELRKSQVRAVVFREVLGLTKERAQPALASLREWVDGHRPVDHCHPGVSPHAPYSTRIDLYREAGQLARERGLPLMTHLAETQEEVELLAHRSGPLLTFLQDLGVWDEQGLVRDFTEVIALSEPASRTLLVHANYLDPSRSLPPHATVVFCPRTHAHFRHRPHPLGELLSRGVRVALGTDSLASNPDLDVLAEARFLGRALPDIDPMLILRMITLWGAEALGWEGVTGSLSSGKSADVAVVPLPDREGEPHRLVLDSTAPVDRVLFRGEWRAESSS